MPTYIGTIGADNTSNDTDTEFYGLTGDDILTGGFGGSTYIYGGNGEDQINYQDAATGHGELYGDDGDDRIDGGSNKIDIGHTFPAIEGGADHVLKGAANNCVERPFPDCRGEEGKTPGYLSAGRS